MRILVTGGSGFIGRNIRESYLSEKYTIVAPPRAELDVTSDESIESYFKKHEFDVLIHSAAKPGHRNAGDHSNLLLTNARMIFNLLKYQDRFGKFINMGSGAIYDMLHYAPKMKEDYFGTYIPKDDHGFNKYILGKALPAMPNVYDFRIFGIFGKYEDYAIRFISNAICKAIYGLPITLRQNRKFDYLYIDDLMPVLEHFIDHSPAERSFNVTPDRSEELLKIAEMVKRVSGGTVDIQVAQEGLGMEYSGDNSLLHTEIKALSFTPLETAVEKLHGWYLSNKDSIDKRMLMVDK